MLFCFCKEVANQLEAPEALIEDTENRSWQYSEACLCKALNIQGNNNNNNNYVFFYVLFLHQSTLSKKYRINLQWFFFFNGGFTRGVPLLFDLLIMLSCSQRYLRGGLWFRAHLQRKCGEKCFLKCVFKMGRFLTMRVGFHQGIYSK